MPTKIDKLTKDQIAQIPAWTKKWIDIGLDCAPADFDRAERAVRKCYDIIKAPQPKVVLRVQSPWQAVFQGATENIKIQDGTSKLIKSTSQSKIKKFIKDNWYNYRGAQLWASWFSYVTFFRDICDWENPTLENFKWDEEIALSCGFVWWSDDVVAISDRPKAIHRDNAGRLHFDEGMALEYRDGWGIYAWHGYRIPASHTWMIATKKKITANKIEHETNAELRRIMLEIYGYEKYLDERKAVEVSKDEIHGQTRRLLEFPLAGDRVRVMEVVNGSLEPDGTRRKFILGCVRREVKGTMRYPETPHEAVAWSYGINPDIYSESIRT